MTMKKLPLVVKFNTKMAQLKACMHEQLNQSGKHARTIKLQSGKHARTIKLPS